MFYESKYKMRIIAAIILIMAVALAGVIVANAATVPANLELTREEAQNFNSNVSWIDFSDKTATITGMKQISSKFGSRPALQVGGIYEKELVPGYKIKVEVIELQTFDGQSNTADVIATGQDPTWSHLAQAGMSTGANYTNLSAAQNASNVGFTLKITATADGVPVAPSVIVADGEEAGTQETIIFKTNGTPWELLANVKKRSTNKDYIASPANGLLLQRTTLPATEWANPDQETGGLGSQKFGPVATALNNYSVPILKTSAQNPTDGIVLSSYINSRGNQSVQIGFTLYDKGDAPASYGDATHKLAFENPYLGDVAPDIENSTSREPWKDDDNNDSHDEGVEQLTGMESSSPSLKISFDKDSHKFALPIKTNLKGSDKAYVKGWIDFNNDGKFEEEESSEMVETIGGKVTLAFSSKNVLDSYTDIDALGARVRISKESAEIEKAESFAHSGEVEDFQLGIKKGDINVNFPVENTTTTIHQPINVKKDAVVGTEYSSKEALNTAENGNEGVLVSPDDGKTYKRVGISGTETGNVTEGEAHVDYIYRKIEHDIPDVAPTVDKPIGKIDTYKDESGNELHKPQSPKGQIYITGYGFISKTERDDGTDYIYRKAEYMIPTDYPDIDETIIKIDSYKDENGNEVHKPQSPQGQIDVDGYVYISKMERKDGTDYVYRKIENAVPSEAPTADKPVGTIDNYKDENRNENYGKGATPWTGDYFPLDVLVLFITSIVAFIVIISLRKYKEY